MGFLKKTPPFFFEYLRMEGKGKRKRRMIVSGYVFFGMIFLLFAFLACFLLLLLLLLLMLMVVLFLWRGN